MDDYEAELRSIAGPSIRFTGPLYDRKRDALLAHARALILPSHLEGLPLAPLEAMASGTPVWLSDIPPHHEILGSADAQGGRIVADDQWEAEMNRICTMSTSQLEAMGSAGRQHVRRRYGWDAIADRTLEVYRTALLGRTGVR